MNRFKQIIATAWILLLAYGSIAQTIEIHHIDVGTGDATLINVRNNGGTGISHSILIDAGEKYKAKAVINYLKAHARKIPDGNGINKVYLDYIIASHYHSDHIGGLVGYKQKGCADSYTGVLDPGSDVMYFAVLDKGESQPVPDDYNYNDGNPTVFKNYKKLSGEERVAVGEELYPSGDRASKSFIKAPADLTTIPDVQSLPLGGYINLGGDGAGVPIKLRLILADAVVFHPDPSLPWEFHDVAEEKRVLKENDGSKSNANNWGLGWVLEYGAFRYYTAGDVGGYDTGAYFDLETNISEALPHIYPLPTEAPGHICAQKVSHHGSNHSSNQTFLNTLKSSLAVISCGTMFEHPRQLVIDRLENTQWQGLPTGKLMNNHIVAYFMTELQLDHHGIIKDNIAKDIDHAKGLTSGSMGWFATSDQLSTIDYLWRPTENGELYKKKQPQLNDRKPGNIVVKVYPHNIGQPNPVAGIDPTTPRATPISTQSIFKVEYKKYNGVLLEKTINCHAQ